MQVHAVVLQERSTKNEQTNVSLVSTLLVLMDGIKPRGKVVLIGATNRIDAIDSALRRPGRFDRELRFDLPTREVRGAATGCRAMWLSGHMLKAHEAGRWIFQGSVGKQEPFAGCVCCAADPL